MLIWNRATLGPLNDIFSAVGSVGAAAINANATTTAANDQLQAATNAQNIQQNEFNTQQQNIQPWLNAGKSALSTLSQDTAPGGALLQSDPNSTYTNPGGTYSNPNGTFTAPTEAQAEATPGYQFTYDQGLQALQRSQAATGITGGAAAKAALQYGEGLASTNYQNAYGNALNAYNTNSTNSLNTYNTNTNASLNAFNTNFNAYNTNQSNLYNKLAGIAGIGQTANQQLSGAGQNYSNNAASIAESAGNAGAAGAIGLGNSLSSLGMNLGQNASTNNLGTTISNWFAPSGTADAGSNIGTDFNNSSYGALQSIGNYNMSSGDALNSTGS